MYTFLDWALNLQRGKDGRRLPGTKCKSSLGTFWKAFLLVYERETSNKITKQMNRQMLRVRANKPFEMNRAIIQTILRCLVPDLELIHHGV